MEFGDVEWRDVEAAGFDTGTRPWERSGKNDRVAQRQGVGSVWFGWIHVNPVIGGEGCGIEPGAVGEKRIAAEAGDGGLEMQAFGHGHRDDFVVVPREDGGELANAFGAAAFGETDEKFAADAENVTAFDGAREPDVLDFTIFRDGFF